MKYVAIFHANLNYAYLEPHKYEQVIHASYETIMDVFTQKFPQAKFVFEASGFTIDQMAKRTPRVLKKLIKACERGQCEFMGAPYAHPIMANVPEEDGRWSNFFSMETYQKRLGFKPESSWNPECTWMQYVPRTYRDAGYKYLTLDFESYMTCNDKDYGWVERTRAHDMNWGGNLPMYQLYPNCKFLHQPFRNIVPGLHGFCRSDRLIGQYVSYFLGRIPLARYLDTIKHWSGTTNKGAAIIIADDAEYTGTTGYFFVKHFRDYSRSFAVDPQAAEKLEALVAAVLDMGEFVTFKDACELEPVEEPFYVEDRFAWHRTYADAWAGTPEARAWDPILADLRATYKQNYQAILEADPQYRPLVEKFWFHMTNAANSDGRWPPPPAETCPFNREWVLKEIRATRRALAAIHRTLKTVPPPAAVAESDSAPRWDYGYHYTEKNGDLRRLTLYELSHHLYAAYRKFDEGQDAIKEEGRRLINAVYDEFARRGIGPVVDRRIPSVS